MKRDYRTRVYLIGLKEDVEVCKEIIRFVLNYAEYSWNEYKRENVPVMGMDRKSVTFRTKNDYFIGFVKGIQDKFRKQVEEKALVIVKDALVRQKLAEKNFRNESASRIHRNYNEHARTQGYSDGRNADRGKYIGA